MSLQMETDSLEYGVMTDDLSINVVNVDNEKVILNNDQILNPLFISVNQNKMDNVDIKDIYGVYKRVLCLCAKNDFVTNEEAYNIYNKVLSNEQYTKLSKYFTLVPMSINVILRDKTHNSCATKVNRDFLIPFDR